MVISKALLCDADQASCLSKRSKRELDVGYMYNARYRVVVSRRVFGCGSGMGA